MTSIQNVQVNRGSSGFGITLSGQSPCVLSSVRENSEAHLAGLRHGDRLLKVNGVPVEKAPHDEVVSLIARSGSSLTLSIASVNGFPRDKSTQSLEAMSSSEEDDNFIQNRAHFIVEQMQKKRIGATDGDGTNSSAELVNILFNRPSYSMNAYRSTIGLVENAPHLKVVVSYLGSVSCSTDDWAQQLLGRAITQMRDQQRVLVAMQVTGDALVLSNHRGTAVARFTQDRIVSYGMDDNPAYFGIVTRQSPRQMSAHVFVADSRLVLHTSHARRARTFKIACQRDPKTNTCKEFPSAGHSIMAALAKIRSLPPHNPRSVYDSDSGFREDSLDRSTGGIHIGKQLLGDSLEDISSGIRDLIVMDKSPSKTSESQISLDSIDVAYRQEPKVFSLRKQHSLDALDSPRNKHSRQHSGLSAQEPLQSCTTVASWSDSLDNILHHPEGILIFAQFLKKEFAQENIFFWTACVKFRNEKDPVARQKMARDIFEKHLAEESKEPVNIDARTLRMIEAQMEGGKIQREMFVAAEEHIYNLMRMDPYPRFLKSELYQHCLVKELNGDKTLISPSKPAQLQKEALASNSGSFNGHAAMLRRTPAFSSQEIGTSKTTVSTSSASSVSTSGGSIAKARKSLFPIRRKKKEDPDKKGQFLEVVTPAGVSKRVPVTGTESLASVISEVLQRSPASGTSLVDVFVAQSQQPVDLSTQVSQLIKETITVEPRVAFLLALPSSSILGVKCSPSSTLRSVIQGVSIRYGFDATQMACRQDNATKLLDPLTMCAQLDGTQLVLTSKTQRYNGQVSPWYAPGQDIRSFLSQVQSGSIVFDECGYAMFATAAPPLPPKPSKFQRSNHPLENSCNISFV